jgi:hypothetical protein
LAVRGYAGFKMEVKNYTRSVIYDKDMERGNDLFFILLFLDDSSRRSLVPPGYGWSLRPDE